MTVTKIWHVDVFKAVFKHDVWSRLDIVCLRYNNIPFHVITKRDVWGRLDTGYRILSSTFFE